MPNIRIDDEVFSWLKSHAQPFEDTPNSVLRQIAGLDDVNKTVKRSTFLRAKVHDGKTPQSAFREPILKILKKHGGEAHRMTVLNELAKDLDEQLTKYDRLEISSGSIRWQKSAEWEVRIMREEGLLKPVSETPRGMWALA